MKGLSSYEFENNDVFIMSPDQLFAISPTSVKDSITFIWMDNTKKERLSKYHSNVVVIIFTIEKILN